MNANVSAANGPSPILWILIAAAVVCFIAAVVITLFQVRKKHSSAYTGVTQGQQAPFQVVPQMPIQPQPQQSGAPFCPRCGSKVAPGGAFCEKCGCQLN